MRHLRVWVALAALLWAVGCDDGGEATGEGGDQAVGAVDRGAPDGAGGAGGAGAGGGGGAGGAGGAGGDGGAGGAGGAGGEGGEGGAGGGGVLRLDPERVVLPLTDPPGQVQFTLFEGDVAVPAEAVGWRLAPEELGAVDATGLFISAGEVGVATLAAEYGGALTTARVEVVASQDVVVGDLPPGTVAEIDGAPAGGAGCAPEWRYPEAGTVIPANFQGLELQWQPRGHRAFRVELEVGGFVVRYFTAESRLIPEGEPWARVLGRAAGEVVSVRLTGFGGQGAQACTQEPLPIEVDRSRLLGAVYYWSTGDSGIMRLAVGDTAPEPFLNPLTAPQINCPACHALSRDGTRVAFTRTSFPPFGDLAASAVAAPAQLNYDPAGVTGYFPAFAPDNVRLVAGSGGQLLVRDSDTGAELQRLPNLEGTVSGQPDWSWQTDRVVGVVGPGGIANPLPDVGVTGGSLYLWESLDGDWLAPRLLVERSGDRWLDRPAFSPESSFIAYNTVGEGGGQGMGNANQDLWIVRPEEGAPVALARANGGDFNGNSWPKWSPTDRRGRLWLAFSSLRAYGDRLPAGERPQLWVTAIDPNAPPGSDPSAPAFWLPYQSLRSGNHIPYWAAYTKD